MPGARYTPMYSQFLCELEKPEYQGRVRFDDPKYNAALGTYTVVCCLDGVEHTGIARDSDATAKGVAAGLALWHRDQSLVRRICGDTENLQQVLSLPADSSVKDSAEDYVDEDSLPHRLATRLQAFSTEGCASSEAAET